MSLSRVQHARYAYLWRDVCAAEGFDPKDDAPRLAMHAKHSLPVSRTRWGNEEFTIWKRECLAISEPANLRAQLDAEDQPRIQRRYVIRRLLERLGRDERYLPEVVRRINGAARALPAIGNPFELMTLAELQRVLQELQREARREGGQGWMPEVVKARPVAVSQGPGTVRGPVNQDDIPF